MRRKKLTENDIDGRVDFTDDSGDKWQEYTVYHHKYKEWMDHAHIDEEEVEMAVEHSPYAGATANEIDWRAKVKLQSAAQKWICHAISNTTTLQADINVDTDKDIYMIG